jgi:hypothetical protein
MSLSWWNLQVFLAGEPWLNALIGPLGLSQSTTSQQ